MSEFSSCFFLFLFLFYKDEKELFATITQRSFMLDPKGKYKSATIEDSYLKHDCERMTMGPWCYFHVFKVNSEEKQTWPETIGHLYLKMFHPECLATIRTFYVKLNKWLLVVLTNQKWWWWKISKNKKL